MQNNKESFRFSYSAKEQEEIRRIREKYQPHSETEAEGKMDELRRLDAAVTRKGTIVSLIFGIAGCLVLGTGMSLVLTIGANWFVPGVLIGIVGLVLIALAYPVHEKIVRKERERIAPRILELTEELMK